MKNYKIIIKIVVFFFVLSSILLLRTNAFANEQDPLRFCDEMIENGDQIVISNLRIDPQPPVTGYTDYIQQVTLSGTTNCLLFIHSTANSRSNLQIITIPAKKNGSDIVANLQEALARQVGQYGSEIFSSLEEPSTSFTTPIVLNSGETTCVYEDTSSCDFTTWYLFFHTPTATDSNPIPAIELSPGETTELIDNHSLKLTLNPDTTKPEDIPPDKFILTCGQIVTSETKACPSDKPCCPSSCAPINLELNFFCGYNGSVLISPEPTATPPLQPCQKVAGKLPKNCNTALGIISSDPGGFVTSILGILMSVSGMLALYFIVRSGYQLMTSRGNPEAIQEAKERLTSAIVGLLLIIFSLVILSVIGVDLLKIPGFSDTPSSSQSGK